MAVPKQVQAQSDRADELLKQASTEKPAGSETDPHAEDRDKGKPAPAETVESLKVLLAASEQKLATLQGKYNSEIQALKDDVNLLSNLKHQVRTSNSQVQDLNTKLSEANTLIFDLRKQITEKPAPAADDLKSVLSTLSEDDQEYLRGEGFDDRVIGILAKALSKKDPVSSSVQGELEQIKQEREQQKAREVEKAKGKFWAELEDKVSDWSPINGSDEFNDWLDGALPYNPGKSLRDALKGAQAIWDYATAIQIFNDFKSANPATTTKLEHQIDPAKQIEPDSSVSTDHSPDKDKQVQGKIYTRQEVKDFYAEYSKLAAKGKATKEMAETEADMIKANKEGRIRG